MMKSFILRILRRNASPLRSTGILSANPGTQLLSKSDEASLRGGRGSFQPVIHPGGMRLQNYTEKNRGNYGPIIVIEDTHFRPGKD
jgi:hypothetical protein